VVHVADAATMSMGIGLGGDGMLYPFDGFATEQLKLSSNIVEETIAEITDSLADRETMIEN